MKRVLMAVTALVLIIGLLTGCTARLPLPERDGAPTEAPTAAPTEKPTAAPTQPVGPTAPEADPTPLMWKVTGEGKGTLYLLGTIHVGDERTGRVLERVKGVLSSCDALAVEFDAVAYEADTARATQDMARFVYTDGSTVTDHMPPNLYKAAKLVLDRAGLGSPYLDLYNPAMWSLFVEQAAMQLYSTLQADWGMDGLLIRACYERDIPVWDLESPELQYGLMNSFSDELNCLMIRETLKAGKDYGAQLDEMYAAWLSGDLETLTEDTAGEEEDPELTEHQIALLEDYNKKMLDDRNAGMAEKAKVYLEEGRTVFLAVGAAHMLGEAGLVQLLTDAGYTVERYTEPFN